MNNCEYKINTKKCLRFSLCVIFCILILTAIMVPNNDYKYYYTKKRSFFMLSIYNTNKLKDAEMLVNKVTEVGGAGYVYEDKNLYYILSFGCLDEAQACAMLRREKLVSTAKTVNLIAPKINKEGIDKLIKNDLIIVYNKIIETVNSIYQVVIDYEKSKDVSQSYRSMEKLKQNLNQSISLCTKTQKEDEIVGILVSHLKDYLSIIDNCLGEIYKISSVSKNLKYAFIACVEQEIALRKEINEI